MKKNSEYSKKSFSELTDIICSRLSRDKRVRRMLPGGRIHIDRKLPFLCVYRRPLYKEDSGTEKLIVGEASYVIVAGEKSFYERLRTMIGSVVRTLHKDFGAFLILEVWSGDYRKQEGRPKETSNPLFRIITDQPEHSPLDSTIEGLRHALRAVRILKKASEVSVEYEGKVCPPGLSPLVRTKDFDGLENIYVIGLEVSPIFRDCKTKRILPLVLQGLHRGISRALKNSWFEFMQAVTTHRPENYQALGRRAVVKAVWEVDRQLTDINSAFNFIMLIAPINAEEAWNEFQKQKFAKTPRFLYRPLPEDPVLLQRSLYNIQLERIEDPALAQLFREKQAEMSIRLMMLANRESRNFLFGSLKLYGDVDETLYQQAKRLLKDIPPDDKKDSFIDAEEFSRRAGKEIRFYKKIYPHMVTQVEVRDDVSGVMVSGGNLLVGTKIRVSSARVNALIQHEVGTHLLSYYNGLAQPFKQLYSGLAGYEELQEGLALISEYFVGELIPSRLRVIAARVIAAKCLTERKSFVETFCILMDQYLFSEKAAFNITMRLYRSGGCVKDMIYLRGLIKLMNYFQKGGDLETLFVGKIAFKHIPLIKELQLRKVIHPAPLRPRYIDMPGMSQRLGRVREGISVNELIERGSL